MTLVVQEIGTKRILDFLIANTLTLKLYSNNITPAVTDVASTYTEVTGGGYASKSLTAANWTVTQGNPSTAEYNSVQTWTFTGAIGGSTNAYGYFIVDSGGNLIFSERFSTTVTPILGTVIVVTPSISADNL